jgi:hypothetical protein
MKKGGGTLVNFRPAKCDFTMHDFVITVLIIDFFGRTDHKITQQRVFTSDRIGGNLKEAGQK